LIVYYTNQSLNIFETTKTEIDYKEYHMHFLNISRFSILIFV